MANQIAAGEVIKYPYNVIKELVENAFDSGATSIEIILTDDGRTLIQVVDNGKGMSVTDARMAFERHATSKITNAADLFALHTMGFRGEALASIAAIAHVDMRTMRKDASIGTRIILNGSSVESQEPEACAPGTNMMVKDLFFNVPARRKFLKKDSVELSHILHEFERLTLVNTDVEFTLIHNDVVLHQFQKGNLKQRIVALFGKSLDAQLIPVETETSLVKLSGFVGLPSHGRRRNALQYFFVNGRNMRHPYFHKAVMQCYEQLMPADMQPNYFLNFEVDPASIDVNIHPTKSEIKFENEQPIWQILVAAIKESLGKYNAGPAIDFDVTDMPDIPVFDPNGLASHHVEIDHSYNPFASAPANETIIPSSSFPTTSGYNRNYHKPSASDMEQILPPVESFTEPSAMSHGSVAQPLPIENTGSSEAAGSIMQLKGRYILSGARNGLRIIDQHRAHVTILYDRYLSMVDNGEMAVQRLIFPESITLSASQ
ncbi:MAG: DNA mismatch repair endonuclease MutL, partial [Muribaculaceae bacterium]|nr:DNA mismatch repair endonuclease MutL [Muribaculaceae bacterium]